MQKILFIDPLINATLRGEKTMTRRIAYDKPMEYEVHKGYDDAGYCILCDGWMQVAKSRFKVGETVAIAQRYRDIRDIIGDVHDGKSIKFMAGWDNKMYVKSELMPHQIQIEAIKVERIQDISDDDCMNEGIIRRNDIINCKMEDIVRYTFDGSFENHIWKSYDNPRMAFASLIDKISGKGTWDRNPFVFAYSYKLIK